MAERFDLFVLGAGSGGVRAARIAAGYGARVGIAEEHRIGGTCVIRGCVPKKLFVYASRFRDAFEDAAGFGFLADGALPAFDWTVFKQHRDREIARLEGIYARNLESGGVAIFRERAVLRGPRTVRLAGGAEIAAEHLLIATGARADPLLDVPGGELALSSNDMFTLERQPSAAVVIGGGYIAVEFASILAGLGTATTLVYRGERILRGFDDDVREHLTAELEKRGLTIATGVAPKRLHRAGPEIIVEAEDGRSFRSTMVLAAVGRTPNTAGLGLEAAGVATAPSGAVKVDAHSRTSVANIHAVGDVTDRLNLTPVAIREGHAFADTVFGGKPTAVDHANVPTAVFSTPEVGTVGLTEAEARQRHPDVAIYKTTFRPLKHTLSGREERMLMKLVVDAASDRMLGCHLVGPDAGEMAQLLAIAVRMGATKADFDATTALHPTASEELVTFRERWRPVAAAE
jgi:glutathione reductase (NADPH)